MRFRLGVILPVVTALLLASCGSEPLNQASLEPVPTVDLYEEPIADAPNPADRAGAASNFIECSFGISNGGWSYDFGETPGSDDPDDALVEFVDADWFGLPHSNYELGGTDTGRRLYQYSVDDMPKVAVIVADDSSDEGLHLSTGWIVETFATCDPAEYDPANDAEFALDVWLDSNGGRVPTSIITSLKGAEHCGWETVTYLFFNDRQYISDPEGVLTSELIQPYQAESDLPQDASATGYSHEGHELWVSADERVAYMVSDSHVQAWPVPRSGSILCD